VEKNQHENHFKNFTSNFLGNHKAENYCDLVSNLVQSHYGNNMSLKVYFLDSHVDFFQENPGGVSYKHRQQFHQDISTLEKWNQGKWSPSTLADYSWTMRRNIPQAK
jgi:hypothetical protein